MIIITDKKEKIIEDYMVELEMKQMELENLYYKLDKQIEKANEIHQRTLKYKNPKLYNYSFESYYLPAENLGGDFYDILKKNNKVILYVSDVTGHGLEAAVMSSFIKSTISSYVEAVDFQKINPANIGKFLTKQFLKENYPDDYFISTIIMVLNIETDELEFLNLGIQDPILLYRNNNKEKKLSKLINKGLPISPAFSMDLLDFKTDMVKLKAGDTLIFNTDGITEEKVNGEYFINRFEKTFLNNVSLPPAIISNKIKNEFDEFKDSVNYGKDDITYLILQKKMLSSDKHYFEIDSKDKKVKKLQKKIFDLLGHNDSYNLFMMGLNELIVNTMEHGNQSNKNKKVTIELLLNKNFIFAIVEDEGEGFNWREEIDKNFDLEKNSDRGMNIKMTLADCDEFFYNETGNKAYLMKKL